MLRSERLWIVLLALTAFLAGGAGGVLVGRQMAPTVEVGPFAEFEAAFLATFPLDEGRRRDLAYILDRYHAEVEDLEAQQAAELEDQLAEIGKRCRERIRTWVLTPGERARFDALVAGDSDPADPRASDSRVPDGVEPTPAGRDA